MSETNDQGHTAAAASTPPASIDFNKLNDALAAGHSPEDAVAAAIFPETLVVSADEAAARAAESVAEVPKLAGLNKAELLAIGEKEVVTDALDKDGFIIPFAEASNPRMVEAIEAKRAGALLPRKLRDGETLEPGETLPGDGAATATDL
jgi:hypothetical protein